MLEVAALWMRRGGEVAIVIGGGIVIGAVSELYAVGGYLRRWIRWRPVLIVIYGAEHVGRLTGACGRVVRSIDESRTQLAATLLTAGFSGCGF